MSADVVPLSDMPACTLELDQTCMLGSFIQICEFVKCCSIRQCIWSVTNQSDMPTGRLLLSGVCKLSATMRDAILNISNSERCMNSITWMLQR